MKQEHHLVSSPIVNVYVGKIPELLDFSTVYPEKRNKEIEACRCEKTKREKYCAWRLLEYAFRNALGLELRNLSLEKNENGKWVCQDYSFSISHTKGVVAVAVSRSVVGVDIEKQDKKLLNVAKKILTNSEASEYNNLEEKEKMPYLADKWTQKESIFKTLDQKTFIPCKIDVKNYSFVTKMLEIDGNHYHISVSTGTPEAIHFFNDIEYLN